MEKQHYGSKLNSKCSRYVAWKPDPHAEAIDAFTVQWDNLFFYALPRHGAKGATEDIRQQSNWHGCGTSVDSTTMVCQTTQTDDRRASGNGSSRKYVDTARQTRQSASSEEDAGPTWLSLLGKDLQERHISEAAAKIILKSWRGRTQKHCTPDIKKWTNLCSTKKINPYSTNLGAVLNFLADLYHSGSSYSAINSARSSLSSTLLLRESATPIGSDPLVSRFLKGAFVNRAALSRYKHLSDVDIVLLYLRNLPSAAKLTLKQLTYKLVMLLALLTGQRVQTELIT